MFIRQTTEFIMCSGNYLNCILSTCVWIAQYFVTWIVYVKYFDIPEVHFWVFTAIVLAES